MADVFVGQEKTGTAHLKKAAATAWAAAVFSLTLALIGWMLGQVAEHPGVPREVGELPRWFAGEPAAHRTPEAPRAAPAARTPEKAVTAQGEFAEFAGRRVEIALFEYEMKPGRIRVGPGPVTFVLRNEGRFAHDFHVEGAGVDAYAAKFSPGRTVNLEVVLPEGEYKISCPLSNHDQRGMHGTLRVTSKLAGR